MESCCCAFVSCVLERTWELFSTYSNLHALATDKLHGAHDVLLHLYELRELLREIRAEGARVDGLAEVVAWERLRLACLGCNQRI
jgi:hypothetical protein